MKTKLLITGLAFFAMTTLGFSQDGMPRERQGRQANSSSWIDENKNGVCDNYENRTPGQDRYGKGTGYCGGRNQVRQGNGMMNGQGKGRNFIDSDKNGICDRYDNLKKGQNKKN